MTDPRRDVAERLAEYERLKLDYVEETLAANAPELLRGRADPEAAEQALDAFVLDLLREPSEGREPDAVIPAQKPEDGASTTDCYLRGTGAWCQYVHGGNRIDWLPVYFGTPSDSREGREPDEERKLPGGAYFKTRHGIEVLHDPAGEWQYGCSREDWLRALGTPTWPEPGAPAPAERPPLGKVRPSDSPAGEEWRAKTATESVAYSKGFVAGAASARDIMRQHLDAFTRNDSDSEDCCDYAGSNRCCRYYRDSPWWDAFREFKASLDTRSRPVTRADYFRAGWDAALPSVEDVTGILKDDDEPEDGTPGYRYMAEAVRHVMGCAFGEVAACGCDLCDLTRSLDRST